MATTYESLYDLFTIRTRDYELDALYASSSSNWATYLEGFLISAIPKFNECVQDLTDRNDTTQTFNITLTESAQSILVGLMVVEYLKKDIIDIRQMREKMNTTDFNVFSTGQNLRGKELILAHIQEDIDNEISDYEIDNTDFVAWATGDFSGSL